MVEEAVACGSDGIKRCDSRIGMTIRLGRADEGVVESAEFPHDRVFMMNDDRIERVGEEDDLAIDVIERPRDDLELPSQAEPFPLASNDNRTDVIPNRAENHKTSAAFLFINN